LEARIDQRESQITASQKKFISSFGEPQAQAAAAAN
jgi:hypothetical protein